MIVNQTTKSWVNKHLPYQTRYQKQLMAVVQARLARLVKRWCEQGQPVQSSSAGSVEVLDVGRWSWAWAVAHILVYLVGIDCAVHVTASKVLHIACFKPTIACMGFTLQMPLLVDVQIGFEESRAAKVSLWTFFKGTLSLHTTSPCQPSCLMWLCQRHRGLL